MNKFILVILALLLVGCPGDDYRLKDLQDLENATCNEVLIEQQLCTDRHPMANCAAKYQALVIVKCKQEK